MGDPVVPKAEPNRMAVAIAVPGKGGVHDTGAPNAPWQLHDGFVPSVQASALPDLSPAEITQAFLSGISGDRVSLHRSLEDSFETAVTLADSDAWTAFASKLHAHFAHVAETADAVHAELKARKLGALASIVARINEQEAVRLKLAMELQAARLRMAKEGYEDESVKREADTAKTRLAALTAELNESLNELRCEAEDE